MVTFNQVPNGILTPIVAVEFDASQAQASSSDQPVRLLVMGQRISADSTIDAETPTRLTRPEQVGAAFGRGSMIHGMAEAIFAQSVAIEAVFVGLDDPVGGVKGTGSVAFTVSNPEAGQVVLYVGGSRYTVATSSVSTAATIAESLRVKIAADTSAYVTASVNAGTLTLTAKNAGAAAGEIDLRLNYYDGESLPFGVTAAITAFSGGAGDVDLTDAIAALPEEQFLLFAVPYTDTANLVLLEQEMTDRFGPLKSADGVVITAKAGTYGQIAALGQARNSPHLVIASVVQSPTPAWEWAAALAMATAREVAIDPARPLQTVALSRILPASAGQRLTREERDLLLHDGVATTYVNPGGSVAIERMVTTYKRNSQGVEDIAYRDANSLFTLSFFRFSIRQRFSTRYGRHKLASDGTATRSGAVITPRIARAELVALARDWEARGLVEDVESWKDGIVAQRNESDPNRLDLFIPPDLVNGLRVTAAQVGFRV